MKKLLLLLLLATNAEAATRWEVVVYYKCPGKMTTATYSHRSLKRARETKAVYDGWYRTVKSYIRRVEK